MTAKSNIALYLFILFAPLIFWVNTTFYIEFVVFSVIIYFTTSIINGSKNKLTQSYKNVGQIIYSLIVLYLSFLATNSDNTINSAYLVGDSFLFHLEAVSFSNESDLSLAHAGSLSSQNYYLFQFILSLLFRIFTSTFLIGHLFVVFVSLINLILISKIVSLISNNLKIKSIAMILYLISPHIVSTTTVMNRDQLIIFCFLIIIRSSFMLAQHKGKLIKNYSMIIAGLILCMFLRLPFLYIFMVTSIIISAMYSKKKITTSLFLIVTIAMVIVNSFSSFNTSYNEETNMFKAYNEKQKVMSESYQFFGSGVSSLLVSDYSSFTLPKKIIFLPLPTLVQYLTPINVWKFHHNNESPWYYLSINYNIVWLIFIGPLCIFTLLSIPKLPIEYKYLSVISLIGYCFIAFVYSGLIPRYAFIFMTIAIIPISFILSSIKSAHVLRLKYYRFQTIYLFGSVFSLLSYLFLFKLF